MRNRRSSSSGFSVVLFAIVIGFIWLFPFEDIEDVRMSDPELPETMSREEVTIEEGIVNDDHLLVASEEFLAELNAENVWNEEDNTLLIEKDDTTIEMEMDAQTAVVNGSETELEAPAVLHEDEPYVPVRFAAETLGAEVTLDQENDSAVTVDGNKEITVFAAPEETEPAAQEEDSAPAAETEDRFQINEIGIGDSLEEVEETWGEPARVGESHYDFSWYTYHDDYENYRMIGIADDEVTALYTNAPQLANPQGLQVEQTRDEARELLGDRIEAITKGNTRYMQNASNEFDLFEVEEGYLTVFYDVHEGHTITAVQLIEEDTEQQLDGYYGAGSPELAEDSAMQMFDLVNADRVRHGLHPLDWNSEVAEVALAHSQDMQEQNYFSHESPEGLSPFDRMREAGLTYVRAGENIAHGQASPILAEQGLMNSEGHRNNILSPDFEELGVGVVFTEDHRPYYTQKFYTQ